MHEIFREGWQWAIEQMIKFWWRFDHGSGYGSGSVSRPTLVRRALAEVCTVPVLLVKSSYHVVIDVVCKFGHVRDGQCPIHWLIGRVAYCGKNDATCRSRGTGCAVNARCRGGFRQSAAEKAKFRYAIVVADRSEAGRRPASSC